MPHLNLTLKNSFILTFKNILILLFFVNNVYAQVLTSSPYSRFGFGEMYTQGFFTNMAAGGTGISTPTPINLNILNPSSQADLIRTTAEFSLLNKANFYQKSNAKSFQDNINFSGFGIGVPLIKNRVGLSFGLLPFSSVGYNLNYYESVKDVGLVKNTYNGHGGLNKTFLSAGFKLLKLKNDSISLSIGATAAYIFGQTTIFGSEQFQSFYNLYSVQYQNKNYQRGFNYDCGLMFKYIQPDYGLSVGIIGKPAQQINSFSQSFGYTYTISSTASITPRDSIYGDADTGYTTVPSHIGFGVTLLSGKKLRWTAEVTTQKWSQYVNLGHANDLRNSLSINTGVLFTPEDNTERGFFKHTIYRFGAYYNKSPLNIRGNQLNDIGVSMGLSFPVPKSYTRFNLGIQIGQFGTKQDGLIRQQYINTTFGITFSDTWFQRSKID